MTETAGCLPDPVRARRMNLSMRSALGESLDYLSGEIARSTGRDLSEIARLAEGLKAGRSYGFAAFLHYYELVPALTEGRADEAEAALAALGALEERAPGLEVIAINDPGLASVAASVRRALDSDAGASFGFHDVDETVVADFRGRLAEAMALLRRTVPSLAEEISELVEMLILASGVPGAALQFDGASAYRLWGVLVLNADFHQSPVELAEAIAHESGHLVLFGLTTEQALTFNDPDATYASPLRVDARPMDGIVHATFVSARMHWAMMQIARSGVLDAQAAAAAEEAARADALNFRQGYEVIREHGRLSPVGQAAIDACLAYMDAADSDLRSVETA